MIHNITTTLFLVFFSINAFAAKQLPSTQKVYAAPTENILKQHSQTLRAIAQKVQPATVHIRGITKIRPIDEKTNDLTYNHGTGFFVSPNGYIVTCQHNVENAIEVRVYINDDDIQHPKYFCARTWYKATVVFADEKRDVALLKIDLKNRPYIRIADSNSVEAGDVVISCNCSNEDSKAALVQGIVSARKFYNNLEEFQCDMAVSYGNSGSPVVNADGNVIGMVYALKVNDSKQPLDGVCYVRASNDFPKEISSYLKT